MIEYESKIYRIGTWQGKKLSAKCVIILGGGEKDIKGKRENRVMIGYFLNI